MAGTLRKKLNGEAEHLSEKPFDLKPGNCSQERGKRGGQRQESHPR
jgi:hypothetical protein